MRLKMGFYRHQGRVFTQLRTPTLAAAGNAPVDSPTRGPRSCETNPSQLRRLRGCHLLECRLSHSSNSSLFKLSFFNSASILASFTLLSKSALGYLTHLDFIIVVSIIKVLAPHKEDAISTSLS